MVDRQELLHQLVDYLQTTPDLPDYLAAEPNIADTIDPYQMVSEWIALRQEMKQQGKLLQAAQEQAQRELERMRSQTETLQQQLADCQQQAATQVATALAAQEKRFEKEQERWLRGLLHVLDALDRACDYWDEPTKTVSTPPPAVTPPTFRTRMAHWLLSLDQPAVTTSTQPDSEPNALAEILSSNREGIALIRQNLLDLLKQQQVTPMPALGQPFDSQGMYAIGRQESEAPAQTVIQEVTRGYLWRDRVLREAQVIVSAGQQP
ncbi:MAG: nucleotide exchange factor GrpE [Kovacikia sp.]